ncbi:MAG: hypothetical protein JWP12_2719 [Bacteroidetes bacterium]|nr:hypothetical protein [Bacteroidota bacterium]
MLKRSIILALSIWLLLANSCYSQLNTYVAFMDKSLIKLDISNCHTLTIGQTGLMLYDIAITPSGQLYGTDAYKLYRIDTNTAALTYVADIEGLGGAFNSLTALSDDYLLGGDINSGLYKINTTTGDTTCIGYTGYLPSGDITFYKGYYYISVAFTNQLMKIKLANDQNSIQSVSIVGVMNTPGMNVFGVLTMGTTDCSGNGSKLYAFEGYSVYEVDPATAHCVRVCDTISYTGAYGAASKAELGFIQDDIQQRIPNVFTPNNDQANDFFEIPGLVGINEFSILIYDRWGKAVYKSNNAAFAWDGKSTDEKMCNEGTYYYIITYKNQFCENAKTEKGFVTLLR